MCVTDCVWPQPIITLNSLLSDDDAADNAVIKSTCTHPREEQSSAKCAAEDVLQLANDILPDGTAMIR